MSQPRIEPAPTPERGRDPVTGLPTRDTLVERASAALAREGARQRLALLLFAVEGIGLVQAEHGPDASDLVLAALAGRLESRRRPSDTAARVGAEELALLLDDLHDLGDALLVASRKQRELAEAVHVGGHEITLCTSIGIALAEAESATAEAMLLEAERATHRAKALTRERRSIARDLRYRTIVLFRRGLFIAQLSS